MKVTAEFSLPVTLCLFFLSTRQDRYTWRREQRVTCSFPLLNALCTFTSPPLPVSRSILKYRYSVHTNIAKIPAQRHLKGDFLLCMAVPCL